MFRTLLALSLGCALFSQPTSAEVSLIELLRDISRAQDSPPPRFPSEDVDDYYRGSLGEPDDSRMIRVRKGAGNCYAQGKCLYYSKRMKGEFCGTCGRRGSCFPGSSTVLKESGEITSMADLRVNDKVLAASRSGELTFSPVVTWMDKRANDTSQYLEMEVQSGHRLRLSPNHVLLVRQHQQLVSRFASDVRAGDLLKVADSLTDSCWSPVVNIRPIIATGAYVPLTAEGTIVVDGVLASCYASFDHDWAHALTSPLRWFPTLFEDPADREADGPRVMVEHLKEVGRWLFPQPGSKNRAAADDSIIQLTDADAAVIQLPLMAARPVTAQ